MIKGHISKCTLSCIPGQKETSVPIIQEKVAASASSDTGCEGEGGRAAVLLVLSTDDCTQKFLKADKYSLLML